MRPQHSTSRYYGPVVEWLGWVVSAGCRVLVPFVELMRWFGIALIDAWARKAKWFRGRLHRPWRWQFNAALVFLGCAVLAFVSLR